MIRLADLASGAADEADALRRAERLFDAAAQSGLDISGLGDAAQRITTLCCQSAPYLATLLTRDPPRLIRVAADPYLRREKPREVLVAEVVARAAPARSRAELQAALRKVRADELVRLGVRELELGLDTEVGPGWPGWPTRASMRRSRPAIASSGRATAPRGTSMTMASCATPGSP